MSLRGVYLTAILEWIRMPFAKRSPYHWKLRTRSLPLGDRTLVMGILNTTPDSFSDGGSFATPARAIEHALAMFDDGADMVDIGGESTRPGKHEPLGTQEEIDRVLPVLEGVLRHRPKSILSIDTYKSATATAALNAGAEIVNDVSGLAWDEAMAAVCAAAGCGVVLMHLQGKPGEWHLLPAMDGKEMVALVKRELGQRLEQARSAGIGRENIVLDPGFGFGKAYDRNYFLLVGIEELSRLGQPLLAGVSRKAFLGRTLSHLYQGADTGAKSRGSATLAAVTAAILAGAQLVRVHDVRPAREAAAIADAVLQAAVSTLSSHPPPVQ
jgi:dihydropteroate synthase